MSDNDFIIIERQACDLINDWYSYLDRVGACMHRLVKEIEPHGSISFLCSSMQG